MNSTEMFENSKAWPYVEARRVLKHIERKGKKPGDIVTFESGYGPSGAPHIGTFAEVVRTLWVMRAFDDLTNNSYNVRLIMFSDDYDGLRKVPEGLPSWMNDYLNCPLSMIPSPDQFSSGTFGSDNNGKLAEFVNDILDYYDGSSIGELDQNNRVNFVSSTEYYRNGKFNEMLTKVFDNYSAIQDIMLPSLGIDRQQTYSPFMPVFHDSIREDKIPWVNQVPVKLTRTDSGDYLTYELGTTPCLSIITNGYAKLQWKVDWAMRWVYFDVDYEMSGKDLTDSVRLSSQICQVLGGVPPVNLTYELFLDANGKKISKSLGNGFSIEDWLQYGSMESLAYYLYRDPTRAKNLHADLVPIMMAEYAQSLKLFHSQSGDKQLGNPVYHIHNGNVPTIQTDVTYSLLLNLIGSTGIADVDVVKKTVEQYCGNNSNVDFMIPLACNFFKDHLSDSINFRPPNDDEFEFLIQMIEDLELLENPTAESIQAVAYEIGKRHDFENLSDWFKIIYEVVFGSSSGPRIGTFAMMIGLDNFIQMMWKRVNV